MSQEIKILPVFISSTWLDLRREHEAAESAVNSMRETKYVGMKYFGARATKTRASPRSKRVTAAASTSE